MNRKRLLLGVLLILVLITVGIFMGVGGATEIEQTATAIPSATLEPTGTLAPTPTNREPANLVLGDNETGMFEDFSLLNASSFLEFKVGVLGVTTQGKSQGEIIFLDPWVVVQVEENLWASYDLDTHQILVWSSNPDEEAPWSD